MSRFWLKLWLYWAVRFTLESVVLASILSSIMTTFIYINKGMTTIDSDVLKALFDIFIFWFVILWSITVLISLFRTLKHLFNRCYSGYVLKLLTCNAEEVIEVIGYGDITKLFRKWMMSMIWTVSALMIFSFSISYFFVKSYDWYNIYLLYIFILISGAVTLPLMGSRCKRVKLSKC